MDLKKIQEINQESNRTPKSEMNIFSKRITSSICDSPFRNIPAVSTPPSRFAKIINPFDAHIIDRLHLPTFSPSVFATISTPNKSTEKFKWTIEEISSLKPADIDETTVSQHVCNDDPHIESIVQQKIDTFFSSKSIVPSPMGPCSAKVQPLIREDERLSSIACEANKVHYADGATQTVLTLPPVLPEALEKALLPYFTYHEEQQQDHLQEMSVDVVENNASLYKQLFEGQSPKTPASKASIQSSPALSTGYALSPFQFSPICDKGGNVQELNDCTLSPIGRHSFNGNPLDQSGMDGSLKSSLNGSLRSCINRSLRSTLDRSARASRSACRLNFTEGMSVDGSMVMVVPDMDNTAKTINGRSLCFSNDDSFSPIRSEQLSDTTVNWDMEYKHVSIATASNSSFEDQKMDISNSTTPHSKRFTSQRKRLSESFKHDEEYLDDDKENYFSSKNNRIKDLQGNRHKMLILDNDVTTDAMGKHRLFIGDSDVTADAGYHTQQAVTLGGSDDEWGEHRADMYSNVVFASTPSKHKM